MGMALGAKGQSQIEFRIKIEPSETVGRAENHVLSRLRVLLSAASPDSWSENGTYHYLHKSTLPFQGNEL